MPKASTLYTLRQYEGYWYVIPVALIPHWQDILDHKKPLPLGITSVKWPESVKFGCYEVE